MGPVDSITRDEFRWASPELRQRLLANPVAVLADEGVTVSPGLPLPVIDGIVRIVWLLWVDGRIVPRHQFHIDPNDEGLLFGRGVWESTRTIGGVPWLWDEHLGRLRRTADVLDIAIDPSRLPDARQVTDYVRSLTSMEVVIRLNVTAGRIGRPGMVWMSAAVPPPPMASIRLRTAPTPVPKGHPQMMWKTFQYYRRLRVGKDASQAGFDSALLYDPDGNLLEAAHANIFLNLSGEWMTPAIGDGLFLPGTVRQHLLDRAPITIHERTIPRALLGEVREAFLTNSSVGIVPVSQIDDYVLPIGSKTQELSRWLEPKQQTGVGFRFVPGAR
jgi:branched-subunit amino acid aminotransferase/4-amino-4-deoxychorismate lyase